MKTQKFKTIPRALLVLSVALPAAFSTAAAAGAGLLPGTFFKASPANGVDLEINGTENEDWGFGAAFLDYDGDGLMDLLVATAYGDSTRLYRQNPDGSFTDVARAAGIFDLYNGRAVKPADYDNDGDTDVFVASMRGRAGSYPGPNRLYRNNGDGTFTDVSTAAIRASNAPTFGAAWGDYDNDGWLDLYVVNRREVSNQLFHSLGPGQDGEVTFEEVAATLGLDDNKAGLEAVWLDYDNDGDVDLYLSQDKLGGNRLWRNDGGTFVDVSLASGANVTINSMGLAVGDYDNDGCLDIYITNIVDTGAPPDVSNILLHNRGDGTFENLAPQLGVKVDRYSWGTAFLDQDNDGDLDLYVINWSASGGNDGIYQADNIFFRNNGNGTFSDASAAVGVGDNSPGYGLSVGDVNDDGFPDMFVVNNSGRGASPGERIPFASILYQNVPTSNRWLKVRLEGVVSNRDGVGARVTAKAGGKRQIRERRAGESYLCAHGPELSFGLGANQTVDSLKVRWPSGTVDVLTGVSTNQTVTVVEGSTIPEVAPPSPYALEQNFPNPFNPSTTISFTLDAAGDATLAVYDASGALVRVLSSGPLPAGPHEVEWDGSGSDGQRVASGLYFYRLDTPSGTLTRKMVLVK